MKISHLLLAFTASMGMLYGCNLSLRDQVLLIDLSNSAPPGADGRYGLAGGRVECATLPPLVFVRQPNARNAYILDDRRVFHRWSSTGVAMNKDMTRVLRVYLEQYSSTDRWAWWKEYGTIPLQVPVIPSDARLDWREQQLLPKEQLDSAKQQRLSEQHEDFLQRLMRERIRVYLSANGYSDAQLMDLRYSPLSPNTENVQVVVQISRSGKQEGLSFELPVNASSCPFVGYPARR